MSEVFNSTNPFPIQIIPKDMPTWFLPTVICLTISFVAFCIVWFKLSTTEKTLTIKIFKTSKGIYAIKYHWNELGSIIRKGHLYKNEVKEVIAELMENY